MNTSTLPYYAALYLHSVYTKLISGEKDQDIHNAEVFSHQAM